MALVTKWRALLDHPAGPKTVFFWAPACKWCLVLAGIGDISRPADRISIPQSASLTATGAIWSRYSLVIIPKNWNLFSVNVFVGLTGLYQLCRGLKYQYDLRQQAAQDNVTVATTATATATTSTSNTQ